MKTETAPAVLTVEQFSQKLQVSRTTVFGWIKAGCIIEGKHFFKIGRTLRFFWREDLFLSPLEQQTVIPAPSPPPQRPKGPRPRGLQPQVNLDY